MPPIESAPMRANETNFGGYLGPHYNFFSLQNFGTVGQPLQGQKGSNFKNVYHFDRKEVFRFSRASSVTIIAINNLKKTFESS